MAGPLTWAERRQAAMIQTESDRIGIKIGNKEYRAFGLLHPLADVIKLITKEDSIHLWSTVYSTIWRRLSRYFQLLLFLPSSQLGDFELWGETYQLQIAPVAGILYMFAMSLSCFRDFSRLCLSQQICLLVVCASAQMISYEVTLGLSLLGIIMIYGCSSLVPLLKRKVSCLGLAAQVGRVPAAYWPHCFLYCGMPKQKNTF